MELSCNLIFFYVSLAFLFTYSWKEFRFFSLNHCPCVSTISIKIFFCIAFQFVLIRILNFNHIYVNLVLSISLLTCTIYICVSSFFNYYTFNHLAIYFDRISAVSNYIYYLCNIYIFFLIQLSPCRCFSWA